MDRTSPTTIATSPTPTVAAARVVAIAGELLGAPIAGRLAALAAADPHASQYEALRWGREIVHAAGELIDTAEALSDGDRSSRNVAAAAVALAQTAAKIAGDELVVAAGSDEEIASVQAQQLVAIASGNTVMRRIAGAA